MHNDDLETSGRQITSSEQSIKAESIDIMKCIFYTRVFVCERGTAGECDVKSQKSGNLSKQADCDFSCDCMCRHMPDNN